jgi:hypothetical protein
VRCAGNHTETWDRKDDFGNTVPSGNYTWKLLQTQGLKAKYLMHVGTSLPDGIYSNDDWNYGLGQGGPKAITVYNGNIHIISAFSENVRAGMSMPLDGSKARMGGRILYGWKLFLHHIRH